MKCVAVALVLALAAFAPAQAEQMNPIQKVIGMIADLETKVIAEGEEEAKLYAEFSEQCEESSKERQFEIKTGKANIEDLTGTIEKADADSTEFTASIEELSQAIATAEADLKAATTVRGKENADFAAEEKDLVDTIETLGRAITIIEKESKGGASMVQMQSAKSMAQVLAVMVQASAFSAADSKRLTALVQSSSEDGDESLGGPAGAVYESHSGGITEVLGGLVEKAQGQLDEARSVETAALQNFEMLKGSLEDEIKYGTKDMDKAKKNLAAAAESKATAEGDLSVTTKDLNEDETSLSGLHHDCMSRANTFEEETKSRGEELKALAMAKKIIVEATGGGEASYGSFLQVGSSNTGFAAVQFVRHLAEQQKSKSLAQLASRMASAVRYGGGANDDVFAKVKDLIRNMIEKLNKEAEEDATEKAYCDKELGESNAKKDDKTAEVEKLSTKIDQMTTESAKLKEEVAVLQKELAANAAEQANMDKLRAEEKAVYDVANAELSKGVDGIKLALKVLRDYYAQGDSTASGDAGGGIISMLEVAESDFTKDLSEVNSAEQQAVKAYETETKENEIETATKSQDVKYKTKEAKSLDTGVADLTSDRTGVQEELDAVLEYLKKLEDRCVAKPEPYAEIKARREAEIAGLKEALEILAGEAVLLQKTAKHTLRGAQPHRA